MTIRVSYIIAALVGACAWALLWHGVGALVWFLSGGR